MMAKCAIYDGLMRLKPLRIYGIPAYLNRHAFALNHMV